MCKAYSYLVDDGAENKKPKNTVMMRSKLFSTME